MGRSIGLAFFTILIGLPGALAQTEPKKELLKRDKATVPQSQNVAPPKATKDPDAIRQMSITGEVVDDSTGEPVAPVHLQTGSIDRADPNKVFWGGGLKTGVKGDNTFSVRMRRGGGYAARVIAEGYRPEPVIVGDLPEDVDSVFVTLRLLRAGLIRGTVLDHEDQPIPNASVFAVGEGKYLNLSAGKAWRSGGDSLGMKFDKADPSITRVLTDEEGRFEIAAGGATRLAVSHAGLDAWPAKIPEQGEFLLRLPKSGTLMIDYDIEGGSAEGRFAYQLQSNQIPGFDGVSLTQTVQVKNGGRTVLTALPPGRYHVYRHQYNSLGSSGRGVGTDGEVVDLKSGKTISVKIVRKHGSRLVGRVSGLPKEKLDGIFVTVLSESPTTSPFDVFRSGLTYAALTAKDDGTFQTERIAPGRYKIRVEAFVPGAPNPGFFRRADYLAERIIDVPDNGEFRVSDLVLK